MNAYQKSQIIMPLQALAFCGVTVRGFIGFDNAGSCKFVQAKSVTVDGEPVINANVDTNMDGQVVVTWHNNPSDERQVRHLTLKVSDSGQTHFEFFEPEDSSIETEEQWH